MASASAGGSSGAGSGAASTGSSGLSGAASTGATSATSSACLAARSARSAALWLLILFSSDCSLCIARSCLLSLMSSLLLSFTSCGFLGFFGSLRRGSFLSLFDRLCLSSLDRLADQGHQPGCFGLRKLCFFGFLSFESSHFLIFLGCFLCFSIQRSLGCSVGFRCSLGSRFGFRCRCFCCCSGVSSVLGRLFLCFPGCLLLISFRCVVNKGVQSLLFLLQKLALLHLLRFQSFHLGIFLRDLGSEDCFCFCRCLCRVDLNNLLDRFVKKILLYDGGSSLGIAGGLNFGPPGGISLEKSQALLILPE
ncbi:hypothetical protein HG530_012879 [Fusarium avenaceum]|nr:hypothetical protein HG530_012879 [Fusarium avenaceum]